MFSRTPPSAHVPADLPQDARGLTRWQYAWLAGFPSSTFGTLGELRRRPEWQYRNLPFPATVRFGAAGWVREVEVSQSP